MKKTLSFVLIAAVISGIFLGCEKKKDTPPSLPPANSMSIDFSNFLTSAKGGIQGEIKGISATDKSNWTIASTVAGVWNLILAANLAIPVASFGVVTNKTPVYLDNKTWEWSNDFNMVGTTYKARLTGQIRTTDIKWEMNISKTGIGAFAEILWYEGTSNLDGKSGQWVLNYSREFPEPALRIDWSKTGTDIGNIKFTYIREKRDDRTADLFNSSYIEYGLTTATLNAFYNVHYYTVISNAFDDVNIEWNTKNHNGHIKADKYFQDSNWHCWNELGDNVICN